MTAATAMIDPTELAALRADLIDFSKSNAALRSDAIRLTSMVDSLMRQRDEAAFALAAARADAAQWRQRVMDARPILNMVEDVSDDPSPANVAALVDAFDAWRMCVERGVPSVWGVADETETLDNAQISM